jgi:hypothetical protein
MREIQEMENDNEWARKLDITHALHPITPDEEATCRAMLEQEYSARILLMPTHNISLHGDMTGFRYECDASKPGSVMPMVRNMFLGHTAVECMDDDAAIMSLLSDPNAARHKMREFLEEIHSNYHPADLQCIPDNSDTTLGSTGHMQCTDLRSVDCKPWTPELPERIGIYHAYIRGYNRDVRTHRLFIVCSGGCPKAADQFCNLLIDVGQEWTAGEVADSEEVWWLRRTCQRARCRLIKMLADKFGVSVPFIEDVLSHPDSMRPRPGTTENDSKNGTTPAKAEVVLVAVPTTDTIENDVARRDTRTVVVHNNAVDTTRITNGILCQMHPSEGVWLFRGTPRGTGVHGAMFGNTKTCGAFPTRCPIVSARHASSITTADGACVVRLEKRENTRAQYMCFDENFLKTLERMQWNRDNGCVELIPVVVGVCV